MKMRDANSVASAGARVALRSYGHELRKARSAAGLQQEDLARDLGVSTQTIRLWESGRVEPNEANKKRLAVHFGEAEALREASSAELEEIEGIGPTVSRSVVDYLGDPANRALLERLRAAGVRMSDDVSARGGPLEGETIVVTGALGRWSRNEVETLVKELGGRIGSAVTKNTTLLVAGAGGGAKRARAEELGTPIRDEAAFLELLAERGWREPAPAP